MPHTPESLKAWQACLGLSDSGMAAYVGVPLHTWRKWVNGTRTPDAAPRALLDLLAMLPDAAPSLHAQRMEAARGASKPVQATPVSPRAKKRASGPSVRPDAASSAPPPWVHVTQALPEWMTSDT